MQPINFTHPPQFVRGFIPKTKKGVEYVIIFNDPEIGVYSNGVYSWNYIYLESVKDTFWSLEKRNALLYQASDRDLFFVERKGLL
jgi:hypothetical protein